MGDTNIIITISIVVCYLIIGSGINLFLDNRYDIDIPVASMFLWPIIIIFIVILDVIKLIRKLIKSIKM